MKKILLLTAAVLVTIYFAGCKDNTVIDGLKIVQPPISGKIQNWRLGSGKKLYLLANGGDTAPVSIVLDSCTIDSIGNFTINLSTPPDSVLKLFRGVIGSMCTNHSIINPAGLRYCSTGFLIKDTSNAYIGYIYRSSDTSQPHTGKVLANLYYFNGGGNITGTDTCSYEISMLIEHNEITQTIGWNSLFIVYDSVYGVVSKVTITTEPQTVQWYFNVYLDRGEKQGEFHERKYLMKGK